MHIAPPNIARRLLEIGGRNPHDEPVFRLEWGSQPIRRAGGLWEVPEPTWHCWCLLEWLPPSEFGDPAEWPGEYFGPWPTRGRYVALQPFINDAGPTALNSPALNVHVLARMAWIAREHRKDSLAKRKAAFAEYQRRQNAEKQRIVADRLQDAFPAFTGPTSFMHSPTTRTAVQRKLDLIEDRVRRGLPVPSVRSLVQAPSY